MGFTAGPSLIGCLLFKLGQTCIAFADCIQYLFAIPSQTSRAHRANAMAVSADYLTEKLQNGLECKHLVRPASTIACRKHAGPTAAPGNVR